MRWAGLRREDGVPGEIGAQALPAPRQWMPLARDDKQRIAVAPEHTRARMYLCARAERQLNGAVEQRLHQLWAESGTHPRLRPRVCLPEALDEARHEILAARRIGADDEPAQPTARRALHRARALQAQPSHALGVGQQR